MKRAFNVFKRSNNISRRSTFPAKIFEPLESRQMMSASLIPGGVVTGNVTATQPIPSYNFTAAPNAALQIATVQGTSPGYVAEFTLYNPSGGVVDHWTGTRVRPENHLPAGKYTLNVNATNHIATGSFGIGLEGLSPFSPKPLAPVNSGVVDGSVASALDVKEYVFNSTAGAKLQLATSQGVSPGFVAEFTLYDASGGIVDHWSGSRVRPETTLAGGQYMLKANATNYLSTGTFSIGLEGTSPISPGPLSVTSGGVVAGTISRTLDVKEYVFSVNNGADIQLATDQGTSPGFVAEFTLYNSAGGTVDHWTGSRVRPESNLAGGKYLLKVNAANYSSTGTFDIGLEGLAPVSPASAALPINGAVTNGTIASALDVKEYVFTVGAGTSANLTTTQGTSPGFVAEFTLYNSSGGAVDHWTGSRTRPEPALPAGQYMLKVDATNYSSTGSFGISATAAPTLVAPANLRVTSVGSNSVGLAFDAPILSGVAYRVAISRDGTTWNNIGETSGTTFTATGLTPGASVSFKVRATDGTTYTAYSNVVSAAPTVPTPVAPTNLRVTGVTSASVSLAFDAPIASGIVYRIAESTDGVNWNHLADTSGTTFTASGLTPGANVFFEVRAANGTTYSAYSNIVSATPIVPTPVAPTNLRVTGVTSTSASLAFDAPIISGIVYRIATSTDGVNWNHLADTSSTTFAATGLTPGVNVFFEVRAANGTTYSAYSNVVSATPTIPTPPAPSNLVAARIDSTAALDVLLTWTNGVGDVSGVNIARSTDGVNFDHLATVAPGSTSFTDTSGLVSGKRYSYEIRSFVVVGGQTFYSSYSNIDAAIPR